MKIIFKLVIWIMLGTAILTICGNKTRNADWEIKRRDDFYLPPVENLPEKASLRSSTQGQFES
jgi:hypothetical protein